MKLRYLYYLAILTSLTLFSHSCKMQNRRYTKGFYIERANNSITNKAKTHKNESITKISGPTKTLSCSASNALVLENVNSPQENISEKKCDTIHLKNGSVKIVKIDRIKDNTLYYYDCGNSRDLLDIATSEIKTIHYSDGRVIGRTNSNDQKKEPASADPSEKESDFPIDRAERSYNASLFLLLLNSVLSIILFTEGLQIFLLLFPLLILQLFLSFRAKKKAGETNNDKLYKKANVILILTTILLIATTFFFGITVHYEFTHWAFVP